MKSAQSILHIADSVNEWVGRVGSFIFIPMFLIISFEVVMRYLFRSPTIWVHETSSYLLLVLAMMGGGYTFLHKGHVSVDIIYSLLSVRAKAILDLVIVGPLMLILYYVLIWKGGQFAWESLRVFEHSNTYWAPPIYLFKVFIPIGGFLIMIQGLAKIVRDFITAFTKRETV